jgi:hypothetical protein
MGLFVLSEHPHPLLLKYLRCGSDFSQDFTEKKALRTVRRLKARSGLFHVFNDDERRCYVEGLATILKPGGKLFLLCFSDEEPGAQGPRRVSRKEIEIAFAEGWAVESIEPSRFEVRPELKDFTFSEGGPKAWFAVAKRAG